jgi:predicted sulfurtransferase
VLYIIKERIAGGHMMKQKHFVLALTLLSLAAVWVSSVAAAEIARITKAELKAMLGDPKVVIVDVRTNPEWKISKLKIKGAVREDPTTLKSWSEKYPPDKTYVFYCS